MLVMMPYSLNFLYSQTAQQLYKGYTKSQNHGKQGDKNVTVHGKREHGISPVVSEEQKNRRPFGVGGYPLQQHLCLATLLRAAHPIRGQHS